MNVNIYRNNRSSKGSCKNMFQNYYLRDIEINRLISEVRLDRAQLDSIRSVLEDSDLSVICPKRLCANLDFPSFSSLSLSVALIYLQLTSPELFNQLKF